jgi:cysteinyl-tRNA synthetase
MLLLSLLLSTHACMPEPGPGSRDSAEPAYVSAGGERLAIPPGVDAGLLRQLAAELARVLAAQPRQASGRITDYFTPVRQNDGADAVLGWDYLHPGDYNQDGLVNLADLAPLGMHFGHAQADPGWAQHAVADGNGDGLVNISDVAPIGIHWHAQLTRYMIESAPDLAGPWSPAGEVAQAAGLLPPGGGLRTYEYRATGGAATQEFRVYGDGTPGGVPQLTRLQRLHAAQHFMYQIQELDSPGAVAALAATHYDALVVEPTKSNKGSEDFDLAGMVSTLKASADSQGGQKLVIAYVDIGEAEDYRTYWQADWVPPTVTQRGVPDFLITADPDGWSGDYPVAFWDARWQAIIVDDADSVLRMVLSAGFDGIYMDWVEAYSDEKVAQAAADEGKDPAAEMVAFIGHIRSAARALDPEFLVIQQNAPYLIQDATGLTPVIDGLGMEDIWFSGEADMPWGDSRGGDIPQDTTGDNSTTVLIALAQQFQAAGLTVWTIDYCLNAAHAAQVYADSQALGFVPLVSQTALSRITGIPPPWY